METGSKYSESYRRGSNQVFSMPPEILSVGFWWDLGICISTTTPDDLDAGRMGFTLGVKQL